MPEYVPRCSWLRLGWLILLSFSCTMIYFYFEVYYLANSEATSIFYHHHHRQLRHGTVTSLRDENQLIRNKILAPFHFEAINKDDNVTTNRDDDLIDEIEGGEEGDSKVDLLLSNDSTDSVEKKYEFSTSKFGVVFNDEMILDENMTKTNSDEVEETGEDEEDAQNDNISNETEFNMWSKNESHDNISKDKFEYKKSPSSKDVYGELLMKHIERRANHSNQHCSVGSIFHSWKNGIITQLGGQPLKRDCKRMRRNPAKEIRRSKLKSQLKKWKSERPWESLALRYKNMDCGEMKNEFENNFYVSQVEKDFPIAYIFVVYTNAGQVLRLLKSIYRPHNLYCIHPDARQGKEFKMFFERVAKCLDNVFVVSKPVRVYYGHISITEAQLHCMKDLEKYPDNRWRYVINLCGREIPIKTNREIVQSLIKLKGYTALNLHYLAPTFWTQRFKYKFHLLAKRGANVLTRSSQKRPPAGIRLYKSMNFIAASRKFVHFILHDPVSVKLHHYLSSVYAPEEHFYSSLYALPQAKGARAPRGMLNKENRPIIDQFIWVNNRWQLQHRNKLCPGHHIVHGICILTAPDMSKIEKLAVASHQPVFFFNKYFLEWDPTPMDCMEERLIQANMDEYRKDCLLSSHHRP